MSTGNQDSAHAVQLREGTEQDEGEFEKGLRNIVDNCQVQLGRTLATDELEAITRQAKSFFDGHVGPGQGQHSDDQDGSVNELASNELGEMGGFRRESGLTTDSQDQAPNESSKPPYPSSFHELAKLISSTSNENNPNDLLLSLLSQNNPNLHGLRTIPNKLNDYKPSSPVLANQIGAGKKPWESSLDPHQT
ncbi:hypothetical protein MJO28_016233 [Puccinia striiformis f. sp. tritici]|nr:hypothetical protein Pst134EA_030646 [Puccinia striiformis f. sp. tritici]KAH9446740.1 hypothetical protein Pst134EA_030646 [Puccinia striiformis f. sp. tritici]KAI7935362.1 hypothetical protein MJO28_016233 [Puccinia striiformis f. sp. tritici]